MMNHRWGIDPAWTERDRAPLIDFLDRHKCRLDVHEPDNQDVTGKVTGTHLDNAMGNDPNTGELVLTLIAPGETLSINLASLLALATYQYRGPYGGVKVVECDDEHLTRAAQAALVHSDEVYCPHCNGPVTELRMGVTEDNMAFFYYECNKCEKRIRVDYAAVGVRSLP